MAMDLSAAAAEFFDASTRITLGASLLVSSAAFVVMYLYMRTVFQESQRLGSSVSVGGAGVDAVEPEPRLPLLPPLQIGTERPDPSGGSPAARSPTFEHAQSAFRKAAGVYVLAGSVHVVASVALLFLFRFLSIPSTSSRAIVLACHAAVFWSWSVTTLVALALFWGPDRRLRARLILGYLAVLPAIGVLLVAAGVPRLPFTDVGLMGKDEAALLLAYASAVTGQPVTADTVTFSPLLQPLLFWSLAAPPLLIPALFFNRFVRGTVGPLFISLALMMVLSTFVIGDLMLQTSPGVWLASHIKNRFGDSTLAILLAVSFTLSGVLACMGLLWVVRQYRRRHLNDQTFLFDSLWLSTSCWVCVYLMGDSQRFSYLLGLLPFGLYKLTVGYGLRGLANRATRLPNVRLLFLRVFGSPSRSEKLFDLLAARWRYAGGIRLISATDVARGRFEPDEFLDFLSGRLARGYISSNADLERRLSVPDLGPDSDGRYRIDEFFCRADTWQSTVTRLMAQSDVVAMDLRGFSSAKQGCIFELGVLLETVPLPRVALLIDRTTDEPLLRQTLADLWTKITTRSPNALLGLANLRIIDLAGGYAAAVRRLMQLGDEVLGFAAWGASATRS